MTQQMIKQQIAKKRAQRIVELMLQSWRLPHFTPQSPSNGKGKRQC